MKLILHVCWEILNFLIIITVKLQYCFFLCRKIYIVQKLRVCGLDGCLSKIDGFYCVIVWLNDFVTVFLIRLFCLFSDAYGLTLIEVRIPNHMVRDQSARLECHFDLDGEVLYSVKWYKDGNEFYRFIPRDMPPVQVFPLPGVTVDVSKHP